MFEDHELDVIYALFISSWHSKLQPMSFGVKEVDRGRKEAVAAAVAAATPDGWVGVSSNGLWLYTLDF